MTTASNSTSAAISQDMPCITCGYNLRGLSIGGVCPECATSIARSLAEQPGKVSTTGVIWARCMIVGLVGWVVVTAFGMLLRSYLGSGGTDRYLGPQVWADLFQSIPLSSSEQHALTNPMGHSGRMWAAACLVMFYLITSPRTPNVMESAFSLRRVARWFSIVLGAFLITHSRIYAVWGLPAITGSIITLVGTALLYVYVGRAARDIGLGTEGKALFVAAAIAGVTMGLSILWPYVTTTVLDDFGRTMIGRWISTPAGKRLDSICSTIGLIGAIIAAGTMIRIALAILPMAASRPSKGLQH